MIEQENNEIPVRINFFFLRSKVVILQAFLKKVFMKKLIVFLLLSLIILPMSAQKQKKGHDIKINIEGWNDEFCLLAHYFGNNQYRDDTLWIENHAVRIKGDTLLRSGMYILINPKKIRLLEFFVDKTNQHFTIESDTIDLMGHIKVTGSENNERFFGWIQCLNKIRADGDLFKAKADSCKDAGDMDLYKIYQVKFDSISRMHDTQWKNYFEKDTALIVSRFMKAQKGIPIPRFKPDKTAMSQSEQYQYMKKHFFDHIDLNDVELLYTPIYHKIIDQYFEKMVQHITDSVIEEGLKVFDMAKNNKETKNYVAWFVTGFAESSKVMGMDGAFVRFVDEFYASGAVDEMVLPALKESLIKRANEMRPSLIGKTAQNIAAWDTAQRVVQLYHDHSKYTIIFFFSTSCGHCKAEGKILKDIYKENKDLYNLEVFAVCTDSSMTDLKKYIKRNEIPWIVVNGTYTAGKYFKDSYEIPTTPALFLLDRNKKIIAKNIDAKNMLEFLKGYDKFYSH